MPGKQKLDDHRYHRLYGIKNIASMRGTHTENTPELSIENEVYKNGSVKKIKELKNKLKNNLDGIDEVIIDLKEMVTKKRKEEMKKLLEYFEKHKIT